mmetsp:Transcript_8674/g.28595  ORF Transcript_8674/g.28595 Transcript_8674/m.28595 type:complete len:217 (-) Transcript_8674:75-725(-)
MVYPVPPSAQSPLQVPSAAFAQKDWEGPVVTASHIPQRFAANFVGSLRASGESPRSGGMSTAAALSPERGSLWGSPSTPTRTPTSTTERLHEAELDNEVLTLGARRKNLSEARSKLAAKRAQIQDEQQRLIAAKRELQREQEEHATERSQLAAEQRAVGKEAAALQNEIDTVRAGRERAAALLAALTKERERLDEERAGVTEELAALQAQLAAPAS